MKRPIQQGGSCAKESPPKDLHLSRASVLMAGALGFLMVVLDVSVVNVATEQIASSLDVGESGLVWVLNGYTLTFAAFLLTGGSLGDRVAPWRLFCIGLGVFAVASILCGSAKSIDYLVAFRLIQGIGAALIVPTSLTMVVNAYPPGASRVAAISGWSAVGSAALGFGPIVGGAVSQLVGWRLIFFINVPIAAIAIALLFKSGLPRHKNIKSGARKKIDLWGQILIVTFLSSLTLILVQGPGWGWGAPTTVVLMVCTATSFALFLIVERRDGAMLPLRLFSIPNFTSSAVTGFFVNFACYASIYVISQALLFRFHYSPILSGVALLPLNVAIMGANFSSPYLLRRYSAEALLLGSGILSCAGFSIVSLTLNPNQIEICFVGMVLAGFGGGVMAACAANMIVSAVSPEFVGVASGTLNASRQIGGLIGVSIAGAAVTQAIARGQSEFGSALWASAVGCGLVALVGVGMISRRASH
ncbi:DHA2 family methylenomycin A resistance protein-like MFS transporter [Rhodococcus sp. 27YEA15]|uniref:MFS transporter n=1 Tax=Rhodococcus sp. 27YEA15 TaxID=3156259 RepID=UPI003C7DFA53